MRYLILVAVLSGCATQPAYDTTKGESYEADLDLCERQVSIGWAALSVYAHHRKVTQCMNAKGWAMRKPKLDAIPK